MYENYASFETDRLVLHGVIRILLSSYWCFTPKIGTHSSIWSASWLQVLETDKASHSNTHHLLNIPSIAPHYSIPFSARLVLWLEGKNNLDWEGTALNLARRPYPM